VDIHDGCVGFHFTMIKRLLILLIFLTAGLAQTVDLGQVDLGACTFGTTGEAPPPPITDSIGAEWWDNRGKPIGGIGGYDDVVDYTTLSNNHTSSWIVGSGGTPVDSLEAFLNFANTGDTVFIMGNLEIDISGTEYDIIGGCMLCSERGLVRNDSLKPGALLYHGDRTQGMSGWKWTNVAGLRVTGLRFRGAYSALEGNMVTSDSFVLPLASQEMFFYINKDSCIIDNCEFWGVGYAPFPMYAGLGHYIHNNYIHNASEIYHGYGITAFNGTITYRTEANLWDYVNWDLMLGGGNGCANVGSNHSYNIIGHNSQATAIYQHAGVDATNSTDTIRNCTVRHTGNYSGSRSCFSSTQTGAVDTTVLRNCWFWDTDSASSIDYTANAKIKIYDMSYTTNPPDGLSERIPTAVIVASADSGNVPLTVKFKATGSSDPDYGLTLFQWRFADSLQADNFDEYRDIADSAMHTFNQVGTYYCELRVFDSTGVFTRTFKTIKAKPVADDTLLCFWENDRVPGSTTGKWSKQVWVDDSLFWDKDVAGAGTWQYVQLDIGGECTGKDSVTVKFKLLADADNSIWEPRWLIDGIQGYHVKVNNGNFESGSTSWTGSHSGTTGYYEGIWEGNTIGGLEAYHLGKTGSSASTGHYSQVLQKCDVY